MRCLHKRVGRERKIARRRREAVMGANTAPHHNVWKLLDQPFWSHNRVSKTILYSSKTRSTCHMPDSLYFLPYFGIRRPMTRTRRTRELQRKATVAYFITLTPLAQPNVSTYIQRTPPLPNAIFPTYLPIISVVIMYICKYVF